MSIQLFETFVTEMHTSTVKLLIQAPGFY